MHIIGEVGFRLGLRNRSAYPSPSIFPRQLINLAKAVPFVGKIGRISLTVLSDTHTVPPGPLSHTPTV